MVVVFDCVVLVVVRGLSGVVRKNKAGRCWGRDVVESVVWGGGVVVLFVMFLRHDGSPEVIRLIRCSMVVNCWCWSWGRGREVFGFRMWVLWLWRRIMGFWRRIVRLRWRVVGLWRSIVGFWMVMLGLRWMMMNIRMVVRW